MNSHLPLRQRLTRMMVGAAFTALIFSAITIVLLSGWRSRVAMQEDLSVLTRIVADNSAVAVAFADDHTAQRTLAAMNARPDIVGACLYKQANANSPAEPFAQWPNTAERCSAAPPKLAETGNLFTQLLFARMPVTVDSEVIGQLVVWQDGSRQLKQLFQSIMIILAVMAMVLAATFARAHRAQMASITPILQLAKLARQVTESGNYLLRAQPSGGDEVGELATDFNRMLDRVAQSDNEVRSASDALSVEVAEKTRRNEELQSTLTQLKSAQTHLVQSEKMASLGALVAGIAHEINTPVGVGVTAASTLRAKTLELQKNFQRGDMTRSELGEFLQASDEASRILLSNLQRAAELIQSFKRVAVDQSSDERRSFDVADYLREVMSSLAPKLKEITVDLDCSEAIVIDSYPGALAQVLTNFVTNSLVHGFEDGRKGRIGVSVRMVRGALLLRYLDTGKGVERENLSRIFDPFFTTKRGAGGSGLGMNIVYNLIHQRLGGTVTAICEPGNGLELVVRLPLIAPLPTPAVLAKKFEEPSASTVLS